MLLHKITDKFNIYLKVRVVKKRFEHVVDIFPNNISLQSELREDELAREIRVNSKRMIIAE